MGLPRNPNHSFTPPEWPHAHSNTGICPECTPSQATIASLQAENADLRASIGEVVRERDRLRDALLTVRTELDRHGYGDFHYGDLPREQSVVDALAVADAVVGAALGQEGETSG